MTFKLTHPGSTDLKQLLCRGFLTAKDCKRTCFLYENLDKWKRRKNKWKEMCRIPVSSLDISLMFVIQQRNSKFILSTGWSEEGAVSFLHTEPKFGRVPEERWNMCCLFSIENDENFTVNDSKSQKWPKDIQLVFTWNEKNNQTLTFNRLIL